MVSSSYAVFHFAIEPRVFITGSESPDTRSGLPFCHLKGSLVGSRERWCHIIYIQNVNQHLCSKFVVDRHILELFNFDNLLRVINST